ncbi:unnamed protein product, partial [Porites lobata]
GSSWPFKKWNYPPATLSNPSSQRFGDASGFIRNEQGADRQFNWFAPVYCALGAQVNVQSSILGNGGRAKEAQSEFLASLERSTRQTDLSKGVRRYQLPIDEGKLRLDLAAAPRAWLMPFRMVINTERTDAYNNKLKQATPNMELGLTNDGTSNMDHTKFYTDNKFELLIDLRSLTDTTMHGSGIRLVNTKDSVFLEIERKTSGSGNLKCHVFTISDP